MNTNETIHSRNAETAPRLRFNNDPIVSNHFVYPYASYPMHPLFYPISPSVIMTTNHSQVPSINANDQSSDHSGIMSPNSDTSSSQPTYRFSTWQDIADNYEGNEEKPKCGKLKDNVYFTQRSASSDMYMLFDKKSDYINNFVNYYFSDKNLARDQKLFALMDDKGIVPLSALTKFPKLQQIDTTVDDLIKAFQSNNFVAAVDTANNEKGAQRRDRLCSSDVVNKNGLDKIGFSELNHEPSSVSVADLNTMSIQNENVTGQAQSYYVYNQAAALIPAIYSQQAAIMPTGTAINGLPTSYNPYVMTNFPYAAHPTTNPVALANPSSNIYPGSLVWSVSSSDYNNHGLISAHLPYNHAANIVTTGGGHTSRFMSNGSGPSPSFNVSPMATGSVATAPATAAEPAGNRIN